jgi:hypothetical protein
MADGLQSYSDPKSFEWHNCTITKGGGAVVVLSLLIMYALLNTHGNELGMLK